MHIDHPDFTALPIAIVVDGTIGVSHAGYGVPASARLNAASPFWALSTISYAIPTAALVTLGVYDSGGRLLTWLVDGEPHDPGAYREVWDGRDRDGFRAVPGVYFYRLEAGAARATAKIVLLR
jgi:hypothetical protein